MPCDAHTAQAQSLEVPGNLVQKDNTNTSVTSKKCHISSHVRVGEGRGRGRTVLDCQWVRAPKVSQESGSSIVRTHKQDHKLGMSFPPS